MSALLKWAIVRAVRSHCRSLLAFLVVGAVACGARSALLVPGSDGGVGEGDMLPPVRTTPLPANAASRCVDAGSTLIYVVTQANSLMSFYPATATFAPIGKLACPVAINAGATAFSMAVDRSGTAYIVYDDGELFRVDTATARCTSTGFVSSPAGTGFSSTFGMGYSTDVADGGEVLYIASVEDAGSRLATLDTRTFSLGVLGAFDPALAQPELTGTGAGDLFAFYASLSGAYAIAKVDKSTARWTGQSVLAGVARLANAKRTGWAFAFWGGDFYTFTFSDPSTGASAPSIVTRFRPADGSIVRVAQTPEHIVGAGVSTCAPQP